MSRLALEIGRYKTLVFGSVLEQSEDLRRGKTQTHKDIWDSPSFSIKACGSPELTLNILHIRGSLLDRDSDMFLCNCNSVGAAVALINNIQIGVHEINKVGYPDKDHAVEMRTIE